MAEYDLAPMDCAILQRALEALDLCDTAAAIVRREGPVVTSRLGEVKPHPAVGIALGDARAQFGTLVKQLGLDLVATPAAYSFGPKRSHHA